MPFRSKNLYYLQCMQMFCVSGLSQLALLYLHRRYFFEAVSDDSCEDINVCIFYVGKRVLAEPFGLLETQICIFCHCNLPIREHDGSTATSTILERPQSNNTYFLSLAAWIFCFHYSCNFYHQTTRQRVCRPCDGGPSKCVCRLPKWDR